MRFQGNDRVWLNTVFGGGAECRALLDAENQAAAGPEKNQAAIIDDCEKKGMEVAELDGEINPKKRKKACVYTMFLYTMLCDVFLSGCAHPIYLTYNHTHRRLLSRSRARREVGRQKEGGKQEAHLYRVTRKPSKRGSSWRRRTEHQTV